MLLTALCYVLISWVWVRVMQCGVPASTLWKPSEHNKQKQSCEDRTRIRKTQPNNLIYIIIHITLIKNNHSIIVIIIIIAIVAIKARISTSIIRSLVFDILFKGYASHVFSGRSSMMRWQQSHFDNQECSLFQIFVFQTTARLFLLRIATSTSITTPCRVIPNPLLTCFRNALS